jgi:hypothetical protein
MDYSPLNPEVWLSFMVFAITAWLVVRAYQWKHPGFPGKWPEDEE